LSYLIQHPTIPFSIYPPIFKSINLFSFQSIFTLIFYTWLWVFQSLWME
jgi:hypothetical protein